LFFNGKNTRGKVELESICFSEILFIPPRSQKNVKKKITGKKIKKKIFFLTFFLAWSINRGGDINSGVD